MPLSEHQQVWLVHLGERVKFFREQKGLSLNQLALELQKDKQSIHRLEKGRVNPSAIYLKEICSGLEINLSELLQDL